MENYYISVSFNFLIEPHAGTECKELPILWEEAMHPRSQRQQVVSVPLLSSLGTRQLLSYVFPIQKLHLCAVTDQTQILSEKADCCCSIKELKLPLDHIWRVCNGLCLLKLVLLH